jgi:hypothetical protein
MKQYEKNALARLYFHFGDTKDLLQAYKNPSTAKRAIWDEIKNRAESLGGMATVCTADTMVFTAAIYYWSNKEMHGIYITPTYETHVNLTKGVLVHD